MLADEISIISVDWVQSIIQLVTAGGFGALVWYLIVKHIPAIDLRHQKERKEMLEYIEKRDVKFEEIASGFTEAMSQNSLQLAELQREMSDLRRLSVNA